MEYYSEHWLEYKGTCAHFGRPVLILGLGYLHYLYSNIVYMHLIHVRDIIANHRPQFPQIISRNQASHVKTLCVLGDSSALRLVLLSIQAKGWTKY